MEQNKQPWFAACLSLTVPGAGQIYAGKLTRGILFLLLAIVCFDLFLASLISANVSVGISLAIGITGFLLQILIIIDAFKVVKKSNTSEFEAQRISSKDPWLSVFLSLLLPGLGHAYIRRKFFLVLYLLILFVLICLHRRTTSIFIVRHLFYIWVSFHAYFATVNRWVFKKDIIVLFALLAMLYTMTWIRREYLVTVTGLAGRSMEPTLMPGDREVVNILAYKWGNPKVGDIVLIRFPKWFQPGEQYRNRGQALEKRVVATEGESVQVKGGKIFVNGVERKFGNSAEKGKTINQAEATLEAQRMKPYLGVGVTEPYVVSKGCYFVLGDNINNSTDSRFFGAFPKKDILGKVTKICWPPQRIKLLN